MKKTGLLGLAITGLSTLSQIALVSAEETNFETWGRNFAEVITSYFQAMQLDPTGFSSILLGVLLWMIIYTVIKEMGIFKGGKTGIFFGIGVSVIITILAFMFIPENFVEGILLQYSAMGAAILTAVPFIILLYFSFAVTDNLAVAKAIWVFYIVYYFSLFVYKVGLSTNEIFTVENIPYLGAIIAGIIIFFGIKQFREWTFLGKLDSEKEKALNKMKVRQAGREMQDEEAKGYELGAGI